jgi:hypothetical protein
MCAGTAVNDHEVKARQLVDSDAVICLIQSLSHEKQELAALSARPDFHPLLAAYSRFFPRCVLSADQWERKQRLTLLRGRYFRAAIRNFATWRNRLRALH